MDFSNWRTILNELSIIIIVNLFILKPIKDKAQTLNFIRHILTVSEFSQYQREYEGLLNEHDTVN